MSNPNPGRPYLFLINPFINQGSCELEATASESKHVLNSLGHICMYVFVRMCMGIFFFSPRLFVMSSWTHHASTAALIWHGVAY